MSASLHLRGRLRKEVVDAGLRRDGCGGHGVVAGDHDGADAHAAELRKALANAALDDVLEVDDAEQAPVVRHREWGAATLGDVFGQRASLRDLLRADARFYRLRSGAAGAAKPRRFDISDDGVDGAFCGSIRRRCRHRSYGSAR